MLWVWQPVKFAIGHATSFSVTSLYLRILFLFVNAWYSVIVLGKVNIVLVRASARISMIDSGR